MISRLCTGTSLVVRMVKNPPANAGDMGLIRGSGRFPWRREWQPTPVFVPGEFHGQRSLAGYSPCGHNEFDITEQLTHTTKLCTKGTGSHNIHVRSVFLLFSLTIFMWGQYFYCCILQMRGLRYGEMMELAVVTWLVGRGARIWAAAIWLGSWSSLSLWYLLPNLISSGKGGGRHVQVGGDMGKLWLIDIDVW